MQSSIRTVILIPTLLLASAALADHNSKWGEGWANMPNDIHNTRIETLGDNTTFRDFVRYGNGAESVNRFDDDNARKVGRKSYKSHRSMRSTGRHGH